MIKDTVLSDFIVANHTPERVQLIVEAIEGILAFDVLDIIPQLEEIITNDDVDTAHHIELFKSELIVTIKNILKANGIVAFAELHDFIDLSKVLNGLDKAMNEYYPEYIIDNSYIQDEDEDDMAKLYSVINIIEGLPELKFYDIIYSVDDNMIPGLLNILQNKVMPELSDDNPEAVDRYREFIKGRAKGVVHELIVAGAEIGTMSQDIIMAYLTDAILEQPLEDRAYEIISGVLISDTSNDDVRKVIKDWCSYYTDNSQELMVIEQAIRKLYP